jgi:hypothetical protein
MVFCALSLVACATTKTDELTGQEGDILQDKTLIYTIYGDTPDFYATTAANASFGLLGAGTAASSGNAIVERNGIDNPAEEIAQQLVNGLRDTRKVKVISNHNITASSHKLTDIISLYGEYDYILDVHTFGWGTNYYASDWNNYKVFIQLEVRLIESETKSILAEAYCYSAPEYEDPSLAPSYEELEAGARIKEELEKSVRYCVEHIRNETKLY